MKRHLQVESSSPKVPKTVRDEELENRKLAKTKNQLIVMPPSKNYYKTLPVKPGFLFFDCLMKAPRVHINNLHINIPETIYYTDKIYYLSTDPQGKLSCTTSINCFRFKNIIYRYKLAHELQVYDRIAAVMRGYSDEEHNMQRLVLD